MMLTDLTIAAARDGLRRREFSARELTQAHVDAVERLNPRLNALITVTPEAALAQADDADRALGAGDAGVLAGIPLAIKDLFCTAGCAPRPQPDTGKFRAALRKHGER